MNNALVLEESSISPTFSTDGLTFRILPKVKLGQQYEGSTLHSNSPVDSYEKSAILARR